MEEMHVDDPENSSGKPPKRKWQNSVLECFSKLSSPQEKIRIRSGLNLVRNLSNTTNDESAQKYTLGRLIRGLGSSDNQIRMGYFTVLVALFNTQDIMAEEVFQHIEKELYISINKCKSEKADLGAGRILISGALIRSDLYSGLSNEHKMRLVEMLIESGEKRSYLALAANSFIIDLYEKVSPEEFSNLILPLIKPQIKMNWQEQNLDTLYLLVQTCRKFPGTIKTKHLPLNLGTSAIIHKESMPELSSILMTVPGIQALNHPVFDLTIDHISVFDLTSLFVELDNHLAKHSRIKYLTVTKLLNIVLEKLEDSTIIPDLFNKNFIQQTISMFKASVGKNKDEDFHKAIQKFFTSLLAQLRKDGIKSDTQIGILQKFLFYPGTFIFEKVTKTKLIQQIISTLTTESVKKLAEIYQEVILARKEKVISEDSSTEKSTEKWWNVDRNYASHMLVKLLNHSSVKDQNDWKIDQLKFLMRVGLLKDDCIGSELADSLRETFFSSLNLKLSKLEDLRHILSQVVDDLNSTLAENSQEDVLRQPLSPEHYETWKRTVKLASKISDSKKRKRQVFHTLFLHLGLQLFNTNVKLASDSLEELFICYERTKKSHNKEAEPKDDEDPGVPEDPLWIEVVVDLFLNLLSHSSHLLRNVINWVFPHLCKYMNEAAIQQVLSVLDSKSGSNPLSRIDEDDDSADQDSSDDDDENKDDQGEDSADEDPAEEDDSEPEDVEMEDETTNDKLRMALHKVLSADADAAESDAESMDLDQMDDDEAERLDQALSQAFKQYKPNLGRRKNKKQSMDDQALTHFRVRVLDLVEIYLNSGPSMHLALEIMLPLLQTLEFSIRDDHQKPLRDRVQACLRKLSSMRKFENTEEVTNEDLVNLLQSLLDKGTKSVAVVQDMSERIAECCIFVIHCAQITSNNPETSPSKKRKKNKKIASVVKHGLEDYFGRRDCLIPYVFFKSVMQMNWEGILRLVPKLMGFVHLEDLRPFRRGQALELLKIFYTNHRFISSHKDAFETIRTEEYNFLNDSIEYFKKFSTDPEESNNKNVKTKFLCNLFGLLTSIKNSSPLASDFDSWQQLGEVIKDFRTHVKFAKDVKVVYNKLCRSLNVAI